MNKITKVVVLFESTFNSRDYQRFGIETLRQNRFNVEIWELSKILFPRSYEYEASTGVLNAKMDYEGYRSFENMEDVLNEIGKIDRTCLMICSLGYTVKTYPIYRALSKKRIVTCTMTVLSNIPYADTLDEERSNIGNIFQRTLRKYKDITISRIVQRLFILVPQEWLGIAPITYCLNSGGRPSHLYDKYFPITEKSRDVIIHALDYDLYLREMEKPGNVENDLGVFLDQNLVFHPDYVYMKWAPKITADKYFPGICNLFSLLEKDHNARVIVAAHPSSSYGTRQDYFGGRLVVKGKTVELVKKARFIIAHSSFSTNYAVIFKKPIIFVTSDQLNNSHLGKLNHKLAEMLGKKSINLDEPINIDWESELKVNEEKYLEYKNKYIKKPGTPELPFWQLAADHFKQITLQD